MVTASGKLAEKSRDGKYEELLASNALIDSIIHQSPYPMWISDEKGTLIKINQACKDLLNITDDEVVGIYNLLEDNIVKDQGVLPLIKKVFEEGVSARFELQYDSSQLNCLHLNDHAFVILDVTVFAIRGDQGQITNAVIQHIDITKRKQSEEALHRANIELEMRVQERTADLTIANAALKNEINERLLTQEELSRSEQGYRLLFDQMLNGFAVHEIICNDNGYPVDYRFIAVNPVFEKITGLKKSEIIGRTALDAFPEIEPYWIERYGKVALTGASVSFAAYFQNLDKHFEVSAFSPRLGEFAVIFNDVTERIYMEQALREREEQFRTLCEAAPIGIYKTDCAGRAIYSNPRWQVISGISAEASLGDGWQQSIHPDDREKVRNLWQERVKEGCLYSSEFRLLTPQGKTVWVRSLAKPIKDLEGKLSGYVGTIEDVTELLKVRDDMLNTQKMESLGVLAGGIAHDFNNILTAVIGCISLARARVEKPSEALVFLAKGEKAILRAKGLTQQLLTFARGGEPVKKAINLNHLLLESAEFAAVGTNVGCNFVLADDLWPVAADVGQLGQVIHNLVINAVQAMPEGGSITILSENVSGGLTGKNLVKFSVTDQGLGISDQHRQRIFDPYFTTKQQGNGLGLATCYSVIKKHDGIISLDTTLGMGSTFTVHLPSTKMMIETEACFTSRGGCGNGRVLFMDDDPAIREVGKAMLEELGYEAECADNGCDAVALFRMRKEKGTPFAAVILDLTVPGGIGGKEALALLREIDPEVKAVVSSGYSTDSMMANYQEYGFMSILTKPYQQMEMKEALHALHKDMVLL